MTRLANDEAIMQRLEPRNCNLQAKRVLQRHVFRYNESHYTQIFLYRTRSTSELLQLMSKELIHRPTCLLERFQLQPLKKSLMASTTSDRHVGFK